MMLFSKILEIHRPENKDIYNCTLDILTRLPIEAPRKVIENLQDCLENTNTRTMQITFLFLHCWGTGGLPSTVNLDNFMPVLDKYISEENVHRKTYSLEIKKAIKYRKMLKKN